ncbi:MAG: hypothetical protein AB7E37_05720 [Candidatus Altimarinota bacterium]
MAGDKPRGWKFGYTLKEIEEQHQRQKQEREGVGAFSNQQKKIQNGVFHQIGKTLGQKK